MPQEQPGNRVPYLPLMAVFAAAKSRSAAESVAWIADPVRWANEIGEAFGASVKGLDEHYAAFARRAVSMHGDASAPGVEPAVPSEKTATSRRLARRIYKARGVKVPTSADASTTYLGFELSPLRTERAATWLELDGTPLPPALSEGGAGNPFRIDLLGLASDGLPTIQEVKVDEDSDPPAALVQLLLYAAALSPREQFERLHRLYPILEPQTGEVALRLQLFVAGRARPMESERRPLWTAAPTLIAALLDREEIRSHIRSIEAFRMHEPDADAGPVEAEPLRWDE